MQVSATPCLDIGATYAKSRWTFARVTFSAPVLFEPRDGELLIRRDYMIVSVDEMLRGRVESFVEIQLLLRRSWVRFIRI